jgi:hypothetical protein
MCSIWFVITCIGQNEMLPYSTMLSFEVMDLSVGCIIFAVYLMSVPVVVCGGTVVNN